MSLLMTHTNYPSPYLGLSEMSFYTEVPLVTTHVVYNYLQANPFRSYGETCIILVQNLILVALLWYYMKPKPSVGKITSVILTFASVAFISFYLPAEYQVTINFIFLLTSSCLNLTFFFSFKIVYPTSYQPAYADPVQMSSNIFEYDE